MPRNTGSSVHVTICFLDLCMQWDEIVSEGDFFILLTFSFKPFFDFHIILGPLSGYSCQFIPTI